MHTTYISTITIIKWVISSMRIPAVSGQFYPSGPKALRKEVSRCFHGLKMNGSDLKGIVVPHAGYMYSGQVAANAFSRVPKADTYVLFGPNHTGYGSPVALSQEVWSTPMGEISSDKELGSLLAGTIVDSDEIAHRYEHSIEVQLPFLQYRFGNDFQILPICMGIQDEESAVEVGYEVANAVKQTDKRVVFIASSDFSHYEPVQRAFDVDHYMIEAIEAMDVSEMYRRLYRENITACGYGPIAAMLSASKEFNATGAKLIKYMTSGDVTGDERVVGYAAIIVE